MPGDDKPQQVRQRKKNKKSRSNRKSPTGSPTARLPDILDAQDDLISSQLLQPSPKKLPEERPKVEEESAIAICLQVLFPYLLAGMGMVMAGMVLDNVQVGLESSRIYISLWVTSTFIFPLGSITHF